MQVNQNKTFKTKTRSKIQTSNTSSNFISNTIYIGNMSYKKDEKSIKYLFSEFGRVNSIELITTPGTEQSKGYAFVKMGNKIDALKAVSVLNGKILDGRTLKVSIAQERQKTYFSQENNIKRIEKNKEHESINLQKKTRRKKRGLDLLLNHLAKK